MRIILKTKVKGEFLEVFSAFNRQLFEYLLPPGAKVIRFDGSLKGNIVHLSFPLGMEWISEITEEHKSGELCYFIDEGRKVPMGISSWIHKHAVYKSGNNSIIEDNIQFSTGVKILDLLYYPMLYLAFSPRKSLYKKYFRDK